MNISRRSVFFVTGFFAVLAVGVGSYFLYFKKAPEIVGIHSMPDWQVKLDAGKQKAENEFDVIVVGSGFGGLSCASLLAKSGYKILVLEQNGQVGGYCSSYTRDGFTFPAGAHDVSGCEHGMVKALLDKLELKKDDLFVLNTRTYFLGDKKISFTGTKNDVAQKLSALYPNEKQAVEDFFNEAEKAISEIRVSWTDRTKVCPIYEQWKTVTYKQKLDTFFHDVELKRFLCSLLGYLGTAPEKTAASDALMACLRYFIHGGYYPKGGGQLFANALKDVIELHGGTVLINTKVDKILVTNNQVAGVCSDDKTFISKIVIANVNAKTTFLRLISQGVLEKAFVEVIKNLKMSGSCSVVNFGVDLDLSYLSSIVRLDNDDNEFDFFINSNADAKTAPFGKASISVGVDAKYADVPPAGTPEYEKYKEGLAQNAIVKLEKIIPGLGKHVLVKDVVTPRTFERFTSMPEGAIYAFDQSIGSSRPYFKTPLKGLYLSSASTGFGGGVEAVVASGMVCAGDILGSQK